MARSRMIAHDIATDEVLNTLNDDSLAAYLMTFPHLDRDGIITAHPVLWCAQVAPLRLHWRDKAESFFLQWEERELVTIYDTGDKVALFFREFRGYQASSFRYHREAPSKFESPPGWVSTKAGLRHQSELAEEAGRSKSGPPPEQLQVEDQVEHQSEDQQESESGRGISTSTSSNLPLTHVPANEIGMAFSRIGIMHPTSARIMAAHPRTSGADIIAWDNFVRDRNIRQRNAIKNPPAFISSKLLAGEKASAEFYEDELARVHIIR